MYELSSGYLRGIFGIRAVEFLLPNKRQINWLQRYTKRFDYANKKEKKIYLYFLWSTAGSRFRHFERNAQKNLVELKKSSTFAGF